MIELNESEIAALAEVGITESDVLDARRGAETTIVVTSAGQKVQIDSAGAMITTGPGYVLPEVVPAPDAVVPESVPVVEDLTPLQPVEAPAGSEPLQPIAVDGVEIVAADPVASPAKSTPKRPARKRPARKSVDVDAH